VEQAQATEKQDGSLVTQWDQWADAELRGAIAQQFPTHGVLSEEVEHIFPGTDWCWIIDPIDGTTNFARGIPLWGISLGLLYHGTPVFGHVRIPPLGQSFHGFWLKDTDLPGESGAFLNHRPIHTSAEPPSGNHFINLCARSTHVLRQPVPCKVRMLGVATYNVLTVANGSVLASIEATPKIWDIAAIWAIAKAAGACWISTDGQDPFPLEPHQNYGSRPFPTLVVSRESLVPVFRALVD
jgi:myo-inositol-1(or 4)-monophosphatase